MSATGEEGKERCMHHYFFGCYLLFLLVCFFCLSCLKTSGDFGTMHMKALHIWLLSIPLCVFLSVPSNSINNQVGSSENTELVIAGAQQGSLKY